MSTCSCKCTSSVPGNEEVWKCSCIQSIIGTFHGCSLSLTVFKIYGHRCHEVCATGIKSYDFLYGWLLFTLYLVEDKQINSCVMVLFSALILFLIQKINILSNWWYYELIGLFQNLEEYWQFRIDHQLRELLLY